MPYYIPRNDLTGSRSQTAKAIYTETSQTTEKWTQRAFILMTIVTPVCLTLPLTLVDFFIYFTTDLGREAFDMPFSTW